MQRYFAKNEEDTFFIQEDDYHHIVRVMRMDIDDEIYCVNSLQQAARCRIEKISENEVIAKVVQWLEGEIELPISVSIVSGLPKGDKLEWIIQKGTELGAFKFIPFIAARSVVKWDEKKGGKKLVRWNKIAKEAAEQSHRTMIPEVSSPISIKELIKLSEGYNVKLIAYEEEAREGESSVLTKSLESMTKGQSILAVFGPEGGLTESEVALLKEHGFVTCGLGPRILRTETAPLYLLSAVSYHFELME
ncbi:16S rRNA (uracil(1498)-N(3))-methyltransferase [Niallia circulans]|uniref:Ribosomal RNA small subunit methyltransferase E n=1 Tax=Niallia circulans TaxID=1397 RepID=A0A0J1LEJ4_NIACI|nr:16S rRNA (uracil(1498)-N(3))-methyltransferase [Niallia circulans]KLV27330.1 16S rRNA methyltransferase [Niallia circulans]MDR4314329.1 16S rRNA (uracil(1498)-N(3))-methyltransferase [Niallia circulans]MED3839413.1 16S rRNA (uracil(1498)-N(3))-methyltransferase [Niallia circulans]MED4242485.1 16S rRNA (uracil(1498)-N(3))-methyltransferase [Niallia circulans]MED4246463.1 16S rRNA (uracil(1498)-N(3))-methyltransferase [Niallia circulans]